MVVISRMYYPMARLWPDLLRAGLGVLFCLALMLFTAPVSVIFTILCGVSLIFLWLALHTVLRLQTKFELDTEGVSRQGAGWFGGRLRRLNWDRLRGMTLRYYSTRRDGSQGWMTITMQGDGGTLRADSDLEDFTLLVEQALAAAARLNLTLDDRSLSNASRLLGRDISR